MTSHRFEGLRLCFIVDNSVVMAAEGYEDPGKLVGDPNFRNKLVGRRVHEVHISISLSFFRSQYQQQCPGHRVSRVRVLIVVTDAMSSEPKLFVVQSEPHHRGVPL